MKLRIQGNSLRLRLTQKEVAQLRDRNRVESCIEFGSGRTLVYKLEGSFRDKVVTANFEGQTIHVMVPMQVMREWIESDQVSIETLSQASLQLLIERGYKVNCVNGHRKDQTKETRWLSTSDSSTSCWRTIRSQKTS
jgi:hypothetical protein